MGTRGSFGVRVANQDKLGYNHFDSYPDGLGKDVLNFLRSKLDGADDKTEAIQLLRDQALALKPVDEDETPTAADIEKCAPYTDLTVGERSTTDWYCLLRQAQGDLGACLNVGIMVVDNKFVQDSLFCEYAYIVNLDDGTLECYKGFNTDRKAPGRYAHLPEEPSEYYGVALVATFKLDALPDDETFFTDIKRGALRPGIDIFLPAPDEGDAWEEGDATVVLVEGDNVRVRQDSREHVVPIRTMLG